MSNDTLTHWLPELMKITAAEINDKLYEWLSPIDRKRFTCLYARLEKVVAWKSPNKGKKAKTDQGRRSRLIGRLYERLLVVLFTARGGLSVETNLRNTTSEIDLLLKVEPSGLALPLLRDVGPHVVGEAKCHANPPSSQLVNEMVAFLQTVSAKLGLLFVFCSSRVLKSEVRTAIAIHSARGTIIVPVGRKQLEAVRDGAPIMRVLSTQRVDAENHLTKLAI